MARIRSLTRRNTSYTPTKLTVGKVVLDTEDQELKNENSIRLGGRESKLMEFFMLNPYKEIGTKEIYEKVWENDDDRPEGKPEDVVWMYVSFLRDKLKAIDADIYIDGEQGGNFKLSTK
jgi:DNA-binding response OmpR family regulator